MRVQAIVAQIKREFWENKIGFIWAPIIGAFLILVLTIGVELSGAKRFSLFFPQFSDGANQAEKSNVGVTIKDNNGNNSDQIIESLFDRKDRGYLANLLSRFNFNFYIFIVMMFIVVISVYASESLFKDRESRELLFWRSLPVTEATNVLTKVLMIFVVLPLLIMCISLVCNLLIFFVGIVLLWDTVDVFSAFSVFPIAARWPGALIVLLLGIFPLIGWMFFSSAFVKKSPMKMSFAIPALFVALVYVLVDYDLSLGGVVLSGVESYNHMLIQMLGAYMTCSGEHVIHDNKNIVCDEMIDAGALLGYVAAILVGAGFIVASIWLRNNRYEI